MSLTQKEIGELVARAQDCATRIKNNYSGIRNYIQSQRTIGEFSLRLIRLGELESEFNHINEDLSNAVASDHEYITSSFYQVTLKMIGDYRTLLQWGMANPQTNYPATIEEMQYQLNTNPLNTSPLEADNDNQDPELGEAPGKATEDVSASGKAGATSEDLLNQFMRFMMKKEAKPMIAMPKLSLPQFTGKMDEFRNWRDTTSILIADPAINDTRKLIALKESVTNRPLELIRNIKHAPKAYLKAWKVILNVYENDRRMISHEVDKLHRYEKHGDIFKNIKFLHDITINVLVNLKNILADRHELAAMNKAQKYVPLTDVQVKALMADIMLVHMVEKQFDFGTALDFEKYVQDKQLVHITMEDMTMFLDIRHKKLEQAKSKAKGTTDV